MKIVKDLDARYYAREVELARLNLEVQRPRFMEGWSPGFVSLHSHRTLMLAAEVTK